MKEAEEWRDIPGWEGFYQISNKGRVKSLERSFLDSRGGNRVYGEKIIKLVNNGQGYLCASLCWKGVQITIRVHRVVAVAFIPNPDNKPQINHKNGIKSDNWVENLEWSTGSENIKHAYQMGLLSRKGEKHSHSKLTEKEVLEIRKNKDRLKGFELSDIYKVSQSVISEVRSRKTWKHI